MAGSGKRGGGERVLESRHLVGLFLGVVLLCGVFFTLGYVMGRNQFGGSVQAAASTTRAVPSSLVKSKAADPVPPAAPDWDFYGNKKDTDHLEPAAPPAKSPSAAAAPPAKSGGNSAAPAAPVKPAATPDAKTASHTQQPSVTKPAIFLQIAALRRQGDALEMAEAIQQKRFPCFVATPNSDNYYRVQVGPYQDLASAEAAKHSLEQLGFKPIIKR